MHKTLTGTIIKKSGGKTVKVKVSRSVTHPIYKKKYTLSKNYLAHDETGKHQEGEKVVIEQSKPISKNKHFVVKD